MEPGILCIIIGFIMIVLYGDYKKIPNAKKTIGTICASERDKLPSSDGSRYYGHIQYFVDGKEYYIKTKDKKDYIGYRKGKKYPVKYNSKNPQQAMRIHSLKEYIFGPIFWFVFGTYIILSKLGVVPSIFG